MESGFRPFGSAEDDYKKHLVGDPKSTILQIAISVVLGSSAFLAFCILRPRWPSMYAARKRQKYQAESLPELPNSLFGWMPVLWRISEQQMLASAGLDAFVFLAFFKMAIKYLAITLFFALVVIKPVHDSYPDEVHHKKPNSTIPDLNHLEVRQLDGQVNFFKKHWAEFENDYLWMYLIFAYFFTALALYFIVTESRRIIQVRQDYLGSQSTVTDKTIQLSGIPHYLQSEPKIKEFIEGLEIGKVESVLLCRDWKTLDDAVAKRMEVLRELERALVEDMRQQRKDGNVGTLPTFASPENDREDGQLLEYMHGNTQRDSGDSRPKKRIWYGRLNLEYKYVDAIDYHEEKLRQLDEEISALRKKSFPTQPLAFVTMDSVASCQMAVQAVLDESPLQLIATNSPAPVGVVWSNTYMPSSQHLLRYWSITALIVVLTVFWSVLLVPIAGLISLERIHAVWPRLGDLLAAHTLAKSLVSTQAPTLILTLFNIAIPYFYSWLSYQQGMISQGEVELSIISKNFFFTFFNFFIIFTALGTASLSLESIGSEPLRDTANSLAQSIEALRGFYVNYIILQAFGLFPLRLLEFGSVFLYPFGMLAAKTPRDHAELVQPPTFSFGFYLPQTILIFLICIVYSVLRSSWQILLPGLVYFIIGYFVYKYQLLYAMDQEQHSTGKSWVIIVDRIIVGLVIFQITMAGQLAFRTAVKRSVLILPLIAITLWFSVVYTQSYKPLMTYIALKSIRKAEHADYDTEISERRHLIETRDGQTVNETRESGLRFINPSLTISLAPPWVEGKRPRIGSDDGSSQTSRAS